MKCWQEHFSGCESDSSLFCFLSSGINNFFLNSSKLCLSWRPRLQWSQDSTAMEQNLHWFENNWMNSHPHACSCQDIPCFCCDTVHIQQLLLQWGSLRDVYKAPDDSQGTAGWFPARSTQLGQYTAYHKAPLTPRQTPAVTIWRHHHVAESEGICYRTGLAFIQSLHREQACRGSEGVTHGGYKNQVTWSHPQHTWPVQHPAELLTRWPESEPHPKI